MPKTASATPASPSPAIPAAPRRLFKDLPPEGDGDDRNLKNVKNPNARTVNGTKLSSPEPDAYSRVSVTDGEDDTDWAKPGPSKASNASKEGTTSGDHDYSNRGADELGRLKRLGFSSLAEVLLSIPKGYFDYTKPLRNVGRTPLDTMQYLVVTVQGIKLYDAYRKQTEWWKSAMRVEVMCSDASGNRVNVVAFGNVWPWSKIEEGEEVHVYGLLSEFNGSLTLKNPAPVHPRARGKIIAQYAGKSGQVSGEALSEAVGRAVHRIEDSEVLLLAQAGLREDEFASIAGSMEPQALLQSLHFPKSVAEGYAAAEVATKLSAETVVRRAAIAKTRPPIASSAIVISKALIEDMISKLPYALTGDQAVVIDEIVADLRSAYAMKRLLSGDVGTGKSIAFMVPAAAAYAAGADVAILVPSQLLVTQIAKELRELFPGLPVCEVISGSKIGEGIVVGTTALINAAKKAKKRFHLVIVDEQHKFSVEQKDALTTRSTNVLEATATAIPRTLALINFGGMDVSVLRESPVKKEITTRIVGAGDEARVDAFVTQVLERRGQVAVIYPLVNSAPKDEPTATARPKKENAAVLESVVAAGVKWEAKFPGRVGILHGKLSPGEKAGVIAGMNEGKFDILVSSLVIEVGVTLPSLMAIIINHSECFGLAQLHQLRGRVARKGGRGYVFLFSGENLEEEATERLQLLERCSDGFELAEADMDMRGFGDVTDDGSLQTGSARTLFHNAKLTHQQISATAKRLGVMI